MPCSSERKVFSKTLDIQPSLDINKAFKKEVGPNAFFCYEDIRLGRSLLDRFGDLQWLTEQYEFTYSQVSYFDYLRQ